MDPVEKLAVPRFSLAERDRRWRLVRQLMAEEGLDVIVTAVNTGHWDHFQANTRYLTGVGGNCGEAAAVFPLEREVTAIAMAIPPIHHWLAVQDWATELPKMLQWSAGPEPHGNNIMPTLRPLENGDIVMNEIEARWAGYVGQGVQPMFIGRVDPVWHDIFRTCQEILHATYEIFKPGLTIGELNQFVVDWGKKHSAFMLRPLFHGRGLGDDAPVSARSTSDTHARWQLEENAVFILKPTVATPDGRKRLYWGDCVVCTPEGPRRLGKRPVEVIEVQ